MPKMNNDIAKWEYNIRKMNDDGTGMRGLGAKTDKLSLVSLNVKPRQAAKLLQCRNINRRADGEGAKRATSSA